MFQEGSRSRLEKERAGGRDSRPKKAAHFPFTRVPLPTATLRGVMKMSQPKSGRMPRSVRPIVEDSHAVAVAKIRSSNKGRKRFPMQPWKRTAWLMAAVKTSGPVASPNGKTRTMKR